MQQNTMINIRIQPETKAYLPQATATRWVKTAMDSTEGYKLEVLEEPSAHYLNAGCWNRELVRSAGIAYAKLSLLESGAVLASFPFLSAMPGVIQADPYTVWFVLDAPALVPAGIFGKEIEIAAGRHIMAPSLGNWVVFFRPVNRSPGLK